MFFLDLIIFSGVLAIAYGCFWAGAKFGTLKSAFSGLVEMFGSGTK